MINRQSLQCISCKTKIVTRTAIGHGDKQVHAFPCPGCGIGISFTLYLDQGKIPFSYDPKPENAEWIDSEEGATAVLTFDAELLVPKGESRLSPFIATASLYEKLEDVGTYQRDEAIRRAWKEEHWPVLKRMATHYEKSNWTLFDSEAQRLDKELRLVGLEDRLKTLVDLTRVFFRPFVLAFPGVEERINQRFALAESVSADRVKEFVSDYVGTGRVHELWRQLWGILDEFVRNFQAVSSILQLCYWKEAPVNLSEYAVSNKLFSEVKSLYISCYETTCRLSIIAMALEVIIHHKALEIPGKKKGLNLWEFEKLPNATKVEFLKKYPIQGLFVPHLNSKLRNGIGHNAAHYNSATDEVVCVEKNGEKLQEWRMSYTDFCKDTWELFSVLCHLQVYCYRMIREAGGRLN